MAKEHQKNHYEVALTPKAEGEAQHASVRGREIAIASKQTECLNTTNQLMEIICERENLKQALKRVKQNKGAPGVDGMTVEALCRTLRKIG